MDESGFDERYKKFFERRDTLLVGQIEKATGEYNSFINDMVRNNVEKRLEIELERVYKDNISTL